MLSSVFLLVTDPLEGPCYSVVSIATQEPKLLQP